MLETFWEHELQIFELCEIYRENWGATSEIGTKEKIQIDFND